jgi:uncharacterized membrane protein (UPF0127 family)
MRFFGACGAGLLGLCLTTGCHQSEPAAPATSRYEPGQVYLSHAQPRLPTITLWVGDQELETEVARRTVEIATGMMYRTNMNAGEAMLFVFAHPDHRAFYMRNTLIPLSVAYLDPDGVILSIHDLQPKDETPVESTSNNVQYALEVPQGWFAQHGIGPGALVRTARGSFREINWITLQPRR